MTSPAGVAIDISYLPDVLIREIPGVPVKDPGIQPIFALLPM